MPFQSEKQRKYLWANEPAIARDWTDKYGSRVEKQSGGILEYLQNMGSNVMGGANWLADRGSNIMMNQVPNRFLDYMKGTRGPVTDLREIAPTRSTQDILMGGIASNIGRKGYDFSKPFSSVVQSTGGGGEHGLGRTVDYAGYKLGNPLEGGWPGSLKELAPYFNMLGGSAENQIANLLGDYSVDYNPSTQLGPQVTPEAMTVRDIYDFRGKAGEGWGTPYDINVNLSPQMIEKIKNRSTEGPYIEKPSGLAKVWDAIKSEFGGSAEAADLSGMIPKNLEKTIEEGMQSYKKSNEISPALRKAIEEGTSYNEWDRIPNEKYHGLPMQRISLNQDEEEPYDFTDRLRRRGDFTTKYPSYNPWQMRAAQASGWRKNAGRIMDFLRGPGGRLTPAQERANQSYAQQQRITRDPTTGRMTSGLFAGKNAPGTSMFGSKTYKEMAQKWALKNQHRQYKTPKMQQKQQNIINLATGNRDPSQGNTVTGHGKSGMGRSADRFAAEGGLMTLWQR